MQQGKSPDVNTFSALTRWLHIPAERFHADQPEHPAPHEDSLGPVQREMRQLVDAGLVNRKTVGSQTLYSANRESPVFREIRGLVTKTVGMHDVLANALKPLKNKINLAFVYGSIARSREHQQSDVDLMVVGNVDFDQIVEQIRDAEKILNREINSTVYSIREFTMKLGGNFLTNVLSEKKLFIIGGEDDLRSLGQKRLA